MQIAITGGSGLVGTALSEQLVARGDKVLNVTRSPRKDSDVRWNPVEGEIDAERLEGVDAVIHLAGDNIATGRWTKAKKDRVLSSRVDATKFLADSLLKLQTPPTVFIGASAIGFYGNRGEEWVDETSDAGTGFLADVCIAWENAAYRLRESDMRVAHVRIGLVLTPAGGALAKLLTIFKWGLGGRVGSGRQYMSWIGLDDLVKGLVLMLDREIAGPVNLVTPNPVTNREFTRTLATVLHRPAILPVPSFAIKLGLGEMGDQLLLAGARVDPACLKGLEFEYEHPELVSLLQYLLE